MSKNEGSVDRIIRLILGIAILSLVFIGPKTAWGYVGLLPLLTGIFGICPLYSVMGWNTHRAHGKAGA